MTGDVELTIDGAVVQPAAAWILTWLDAEAGIARLSDGSRSVPCLVEGAGSEWVVTLHGRRVPVTARTWRDRVLGEAESAARGQVGPIEVQATLPGLVVAVMVADDDEVAEGDTLLIIEAMKMQNEVRSPRAGRVSGLSAAAGRTVAVGAPLLRIE